MSKNIKTAGGLIAGLLVFLMVGQVSASSMLPPATMLCAVASELCEQPPSFVPPVVSFVSPNPGQIFNVRDSVTLSAIASASNGALISSMAITGAPGDPVPAPCPAKANSCTSVVNGLSVGSHTYTASAIDDSPGTMRGEASVTFSVVADPDPINTEPEITDLSPKAQQPDDTSSATGGVQVASDTWEYSNMVEGGELPLTFTVQDVRDLDASNKEVRAKVSKVVITMTNFIPSSGPGVDDSLGDPAYLDQCKDGILDINQDAPYFFDAPSDCRITMPKYVDTAGFSNKYIVRIVATDSSAVPASSAPAELLVNVTKDTGVGTGTAPTITLKPESALEVGRQVDLTGEVTGGSDGSAPLEISQIYLNGCGFADAVVGPPVGTKDNLKHSYKLSWTPTESGANCPMVATIVNKAGNKAEVTASMTILKPGETVGGAGGAPNYSQGSRRW